MAGIKEDDEIMTAPEVPGRPNAYPAVRANPELATAGPSTAVARKPSGRRTSGAELCNGRVQTHSGAPHSLWVSLGFTLVELLIAIAIIGALMAIAIPNYSRHIEQARVTKVISEMKILENEILVYAMDNDSYPESLADIGRANVLDPWGNPYQYLNIATASGVGKMRKDRFLVPINSDFDLYSMGPDGRSVSPLTSKLSYDDIIRGSNGSYFGVASGY
jgi:general secretion pathway protein G